MRLSSQLPAISRQPSTITGGFSLMELLVVLVLLGFMAGITGPSIGRFLDGLKVKKQTTKIMSAFRYGRLTSIASGKAVSLSLGEDERTILFTGGITESRNIELGEEESLELDPTEVTFYPEGQVTPGTVVYNMGEKKRTFLLDPLTGMALLQ